MGKPLRELYSLSPLPLLILRCGSRAATCARGGLGRVRLRGPDHLHSRLRRIR
jgi:hypothetical protein